ncbi:hypothetical protein W97_05671 [Coniosporium apollinis CBS 100218]|uniref:Uncharacterized protein n=1 Tax=Coniosporium apollinis (strain CBS 100218) TaxID=1168221 RepID=R7YWQ9_CONA1|nr:uncharacterized protein W97_05671 [Coniosporium apollinis CBS 100218]EON66278.1 hypothetical protein W97_05671 [Coniosporium apollinis CBS 100218]
MPAEELSDDYVAELLKKDAKSSSSRYAVMGLGALLPRRTGQAPKPNTRFLRNILRETDSHNAALLAKEAEDSRARLKALRKEGAGKPQQGLRDCRIAKPRTGIVSEGTAAAARNGIGLVGTNLQAASVSATGDQGARTVSARSMGHGEGIEAVGSTVAMMRVVGRAVLGASIGVEERSTPAAQTKRTPNGKRNHTINTDAADHELEAHHDPGHQIDVEISGPTTRTERDRHHPDLDRPRDPKSRAKGGTENMTSILGTALQTASKEHQHQGLHRQEQPTIQTHWKLS